MCPDNDSRPLFRVSEGRPFSGLGSSLPGLQTRANPPPQFHLAQIDAEGVGVPADVQEAIEWYTKAAKKNNRAAFMFSAVLS